MNAWVIIAAAGSSERYGAGDKLAQDLGGRAVLLRSVEAFAKRKEVSGIVVAGPPDRMDEFRDRYGPTLGFHGAKLVAGGRAERWQTVGNGLAEIPGDATHVAVHDAARPGVSDELLDRVFEAAALLPAVIPALDVDATVKRVATETVDVGDEDDALADAILGDTGGRNVTARCVTETIDRRGLVLVQTPQVFEAALLRRAYEQEDCSGATDDAALVERLGETVHVVEGDPRNFKITRPGDLKRMQQVLGLKAAAERPVHKRF